MIHSIAEWIVNGTANNSVAVPHAVLVFGFAALVNNGLKMTWTYAEMPRWARFVLGVTMPLALNFFHVAERTREGER